MNYKKNEIALFHCQFGSCSHVACQLSFTRADNPAGVPKCESFSANFAFGRNPVPRDPWLAMHDGNATARNPIEQRRFSDVWPATIAMSIATNVAQAS